MTGRLVALLVGIDRYPPPVPPLAGCVADVAAVGTVLRQRVGEGALELCTLLDAAATRESVVGAIRSHLGLAGPGDTALLYYSGHGSQQAAPPELWAVEPDRRNETLVLADSREPGQWDLADRELGMLLGEVAATGCHLVTVLDCCHSGSGTRSDDPRLRPRLAPPDTRPRPFTSFLAGVPTATVPADPTVARTRSARWRSTGGASVLLAACRESETAKEVSVAGHVRGIMSAALEAILRDHPGLTARQLHRHVAAAVERAVRDQHPQLETGDPATLDQPFLGEAAPAGPRTHTVTAGPDGWRLDAGSIHGIAAPAGADTTHLALHELTGDLSQPPTATAEVTRVLLDHSLVRVSRALPSTASYRALVTVMPWAPLTVVTAGDPGAVAALLEAGTTADLGLISFADGHGSAPVPVPDLAVEASAEAYTLLRPGAPRPLVSAIAGEGRAARAVAALEHVARWLRVSRLHNPASALQEGAVTVHLTTPAGETARDGRLTLSYTGRVPPAFTVTLGNTTDIRLWCALIDLTDAHGMFTDAFPAGSVALGAGESVSVDLLGQVSDAQVASGVGTVTDHLVVVTSTREFDPRSLQQEELDPLTAASPPVVRGDVQPRSTLDRLLARATTRRVGPAVGSEPPADWRTDAVDVVTTRLSG